MTWDTSFQPFLACNGSVEKSADSLLGIPLHVTVSLRLAASQILSLSFILGNAIVISPGCFYFGTTVWDSLGFLGFLQGSS